MTDIRGVHAESRPETETLEKDQLDGTRGPEGLHQLGDVGRPDVVTQRLEAAVGRVTTSTLVASHLITVADPFPDVGPGRQLDTETRGTDREKRDPDRGPEDPVSATLQSESTLKGTGISYRMKREGRRKKTRGKSQDRDREIGR